MVETKVAVETAIRAGRILSSHWRRAGLAVREKGSAINAVTEVDYESERIIRAELNQSFPEYGILSEEGGEVRGRNPARWIVDPLDGTTNYIAGYPVVAVSIALEIEGRLVLGVVHNPVTDELFVAENGKGATLNGSAIQVSTVSDPGRSLIASGFPYDAWETEDNNTREWARFISVVRSLRCDGSTALDLCHVACGQLDGYWEKGVYPWDIAAGIVIAREAGAAVTDWQGRDDFLSNGEVVAANQALHGRMISIIAEVRSPPA